MRALLLAIPIALGLSACTTTNSETLPGLRQQEGEDLSDSIQRDLRDGTFDFFRTEF